jgi:hypothetical protein
VEYQSANVLGSQKSHSLCLDDGQVAVFTFSTICACIWIETGIKDKKWSEVKETEKEKEKERE